MPHSDSWMSGFRVRARRVAARLTHRAPGEAPDDRRLYLPRVLAIGPDEIADPGEEAARRIVRRLAEALRSERARGRAGHWTYDLNRHVALIRAYKAERRRLVQLAGVKRLE
jgi:hypothetical protein